MGGATKHCEAIGRKGVSEHLRKRALWDGAIESLCPYDLYPIQCWGLIFPHQGVPELACRDTPSPAKSTLMAMKRTLDMESINS